MYLSDEYFRLGDVNNMSKYLEKALGIAQSKYRENILTILTIKLKRASFYRKISMYEESFKELANILSYEKKLPWEMRYDLHNDMGIVLRHLKKFKAAQKHYEEALKIWKNNTHFPNAAIENNFAMLYKDQNLTDKALNHLLKAINIHRRLYGEGGRNTALATNYLNLGSFYDDMGRYRESEKYYKMALEIRQRVYGSQGEPVASLYSNMSVMQHHSGNNEKAFVYASKAFEGFVHYTKKLLPNLDSKKSQSYIRDNKRFLNHFMDYGYLAYKQENNKDPKTIKEKIFQGWVDYKGSLFDNLNITMALILSSTDKKVEKLLSSLLMKERYLAKLYQRFPKRSKRKIWKEKIKETENAIAMLRRKISLAIDRPDYRDKFTSASLHDISMHLEKNELYIDYARTDKNYYIFSLDSQENITFQKLNRDTTLQIDQLVHDFRRNIDTIVNEHNLTAGRMQVLKEQAKKILSKLYRFALYEPLSKVITNHSKLVISPDGALRLIPFEALYDKSTGNYLIESKKIRYIPNGKELVRLYSYVYKTDNTDSIIFANPDYNADIASIRRKERENEDLKGWGTSYSFNRSGVVRSLFRMRFSPLPGTQAEAHAIETLLGKTRVKEYIETNATESNLFKIKRPKILHIATHGFFINDKTIPNPMLKSGIALSGANISAIRGQSDGIVTALKLVGLDLKGTDLVVLSACNTGVVDPRSTESVSGLAKAFIQAGAKDIVMSLWSVNDQSTKELMTSFYRQIDQKKSYIDALREAKLKMIRRNMHPYFWGPFILSGK